MLRLHTLIARIGILALAGVSSACTSVSFLIANTPASFGPHERKTNIAYGADRRQRLDVYWPMKKGPAQQGTNRPVVVFWDITVPMLLPALVAGWLLSFTLSLDDLVISSFVSGPGATTLPMFIFAKVRLGVTPDINAITTIIIALVFISVMTAALLVSRRRPGVA